MTQRLLYSDEDSSKAEAASSTFADNMRLPVHRWFRYSAGYSAAWLERLLEDQKATTVLDPFAGAGTTLLAAEKAGARSFGVESHPFVARIARAKLHYRSDPEAFEAFARRVRTHAKRLTGNATAYPPLVRKCFSEEALMQLDQLRRAWELDGDGSPASELVWLTLVAILRQVSHVGTAPWQYVLPKKTKKASVEPFHAYGAMARMIATDMAICAEVTGPNATLLEDDARTCAGVPNASIDLVVTSPPYANNYDYADATRLEMCFMREIEGWGDLQSTVRSRLIRSCSQHVPERAVDLEETLASPELAPILEDLTRVCRELATVRLAKGGKKTYHLMVACYFLDIAKVWQAMRRVCKKSASACFVIGDSAPYGVYVPVADWMGALAQAAGFAKFEFEKTRDRNIKWKNRKHRVPLCEGRMWVRGSK